ncbi:MAG: sensor histidine kinase [Bdellovibrionota bacterium]
MEKINFPKLGRFLYILLLLTNYALAKVEINQPAIYRLKETYTTYHDTSGNLKYEDVKKLPFNSNLKGGFFKGSVWGKTSICNHLSKPVYFLYKDLIDSIEIYSDQFAAPAEHKFSGHNKLADHFWVLIELPVQGCSDLYVRFTSGDVFNFHTYILDRDSFNKLELNYLLFYGFFYSVVLLVLLLTLIFFIKTRDSLYFWFGLLVVFQDILGASLLNGFLFRFAMPSDYFLEYDVGNFFAPVMNIALVVFAHKFVGNRHKILTWISGAFIAVQVLVVMPIIINFFFPFHSQNIFTSQVVNTSILVSCLWVLIVAGFNLKNPNSWFFIYASGPKVVGSFIKTLLLQGDISDSVTLLNFDMNFIIYNIGVLGSLIEALVITSTLVLSYFKNIEEKSKELQIAGDRLKKAEFEAELVSTYQQVAHDIRSPLTALRVVSMNKSKMPPELSDVLTNAIDRIKEIASDLNKKGNAELLKQNLNKQTFIKLVEDLLAEKRIEYKNKGSIHIEENFLNHDEDFSLPVDTTSIKRALSNLINNAAEATNFKGLISVSIEKEKSSLVLSIKDNGKGMSPDILENLGVKGFSHGKNQSDSSGSGLGYNYAMTVVNRHNGSIEVTSKPDNGTEIKIKLPITL